MIKKLFSNTQKRKRLRTKIDIVYSLVAFLIIGGFAFFYSTKLFFADTVDILNTEIGKEFAINNLSKFTVNEWVYDEETSKMQVTLITSNLTDHLSDLEFVAVSKSNLKKSLPTKVVYSTHDVYMIMIEDVPKNFGQVALRLVKQEINLEKMLSIDTINSSESDEQTEIKDSILVSIYADQRVIETGTVKQQKVKEYAFKITNELITETENSRELLMKDIQKNTLFISRIKEEIEVLKKELIYQTTAEQDVTNNKIFSLENEIESFEKKNSDILVDVDSFDAKIERLIQRKRDLQF
ncbi:hypothetical protein [Lysinibacillus fusiformis]|uniref:hypothetical protein n=1 Tax=Lysinibacillus fusiformis TaxID=28031 RepID=UPI000D373A48|nr:hypothetical protein [Lysinibacillus fusiformis]MED4672327.1 hypothetical protein [Lysinibacillus fusiformis]RDV25304.1 hypothetical protein C7B90_22880 [Lysinibacillus fusiformis]GED65634.1 hypothetical protein LFU01_40860 [Lysinibacillus fusiformis]